MVHNNIHEESTDWAKYEALVLRELERLDQYAIESRRLGTEEREVSRVRFREHELAFADYREAQAARIAFIEKECEAKIASLELRRQEQFTKYTVRHDEQAQARAESLASKRRAARAEFKKFVDQKYEPFVVEVRNRLQASERWRWAFIGVGTLMLPLIYWGITQVLAHFLT